MKADDLAWVQAQLRSCRCIAKQLKVCAEVTGQSEGVLLYELGYEDLHALQRAYPEKQSWYHGKKNIVATEPPPKRSNVPDDATMKKTVRMYVADNATMEKAVRMYVAGAPLAKVAAQLGYTEPPTPRTLAHCVSRWRARHPKIDAQLPARRTYTKRRKR